MESISHVGYGFAREKPVLSELCETPCENGGRRRHLYVPPKDEDLSTEARGGASRTPKPRADSAPKNLHRRVEAWR